MLSKVTLTTLLTTILAKLNIRMSCAVEELDMSAPTFLYADDLFYVGPTV